MIPSNETLPDRSFVITSTMIMERQNNGVARECLPRVNSSTTRWEQAETRLGWDDGRGLGTGAKEESCSEWLVCTDRVPTRQAPYQCTPNRRTTSRTTTTTQTQEWPGCVTSSKNYKNGSTLVTKSSLVGTSTALCLIKTSLTYLKNTS